MILVTCIYTPIELLDTEYNKKIPYKITSRRAGYCRVLYRYILCKKSFMLGMKKGIKSYV